MNQDFCEYCNATLPEVEKLVTVYRHRNGRHFIFEHVPARVCTSCGERYFSAKAVSEMEREIKLPASPSNLISVPLIELHPVG